MRLLGANQNEIENSYFKRSMMIEGKSNLLFPGNQGGLARQMELSISGAV